MFSSDDLNFKLGELFCGPGGLGNAAVGLRVPNCQRSALITHGWASDYDRDSCDTYAENIGHKDSVVCADIRKLGSFQKLKDISDVNALAFGFPCNDFSMVGERRGMDGAYGPLYQYCVEAVEFFKPDWFLAENVSGLKNANDGQAFKTILGDFENCGYRLYPHLYKFEQYGVPQARHRIIIVGIRDDHDVEFKIPSTAPFETANVGARNAVENPPIPEDASNHERTAQSKTVVERLSYIKPGENAFTADLPEHLKLNVKGATISQIYKRIHPDQPSYTITGSGGGGTHGYHWTENRALTNRERARLQTFPDDFIFSGSKESVRKQIGMAVPPKGAKIIFEALLKSFLNISYDYIEPNIEWGQDEPVVDRQSVSAGSH